MKTCLECGKEMKRAKGCDDKRWAVRRFCNATCGARHAGNMGGTSIDTPAHISAASATLNDLIWDMYERLAGERGHATLWEAAVECGMRV